MDGKCKQAKYTEKQNAMVNGNSDKYFQNTK